LCPLFELSYKKTYFGIGFEVLTAVSTKMADFWVVAPFSLMMMMMMEALRAFEMLVNFY
jgi:hypothetical protein